MNPNLKFNPPLIDYEKRNYSYYVQTMLEAMVQRDPKKRVNIKTICKYCYFEKSSYYQELLKEDKKYP